MMDFGDAIRSMKAGKKVARSAWNSKNMWIALTPGSNFQPQHAKDGHATKLRADEVGMDGTITLLPYIDMRAADGSMVVAG